MTVNGITTSYSYNLLDQLLTASTPSSTISYSYDGRGNRISASDGTNTTSFSYDARDRLLGMTLPNATNISYGYDADGHRVSQRMNGQVTRYVWDEASRYGDVLLELNGSGSVTVSYVLGNSLISQFRENTVSYFSQDALGSTRTLTDAAGTITDTYTYSAFGESYARTGATVNPYQFTGQQYDVATGLYSMRARYYDPSVGRFLTRDTASILFDNPVELNRYVYVANNPIRHTDPTGRFIDYGFKTKSSATEESAALRYAVGYLTRVEARERAIAFGLVATSILLAKLIELVEWLVLPQLQPQPAPTPDQPPAPAPAPAPEFDPSSDPDRDRENPRRKHIVLGLNTIRTATTMEGDALVTFWLALRTFYAPLNINVYAFWEWNQAGISITPTSPAAVNFPQAFAEAMDNVRAGNVDRIHFNLTGVVPYLAQSYTQFADAGVVWDPSRITSWELNTIRQDPVLCSRTTFYDGWIGTLPQPNLAASVELCGLRRP